MTCLFHKKLFLVTWVCVWCVVCYAQDKDISPDNNTSSVEHKNLQLDLYLDLIRYNTQEKIGVLPYILQNPEGVYLEIGTGGDPIAEMMVKIPADCQTTVIASDIDDGVLNSLAQRHPELQKYLKAQQGPKLKLQQLDATDMSIFENNFLSGINASSVLHEIISYAGGFDGMEKFFKQAFRILKVGGILVYRDPENVAHAKSAVTVSLKTKAMRLFAHIFLYKFLEKQGSSLAKAGRKVFMYSPDEITFKIYKKSESSPVSLSYKQYLETPSYDIDFSRNYAIELPFGLYRELARHYLTYLHQCNPLMFVKCIPDVSSEKYLINYLAYSTCALFDNFLKKNNWELADNRIDLTQKSQLDLEIAKNMKVLEFGVPLHFSSNVKKAELCELLKKYELNPGSYIIALDNGDCLLDYRIFGIFYDEITQTIFDRFNGLVDKKDEEHAQWLKREGEEYYFYYSPDELIAKVLEITVTECANSDGNKEYFVLCPLSEKHNTFVGRLCYTEILNSSLAVHDNLGYPLEVKDGKRVIHFAKMNLENALVICENLIAQDPFGYPCLQETVDGLKAKYTC